MINKLVALIAITAAFPAFTQPNSDGYVLRVGEGELACCDTLIKASPRSGTQGGVMMLQPMPPEFSTGIHFHVEADEFFYVVSGNGEAFIGDLSFNNDPGDVIFVPAGQDHKLVAAEETLLILEFLDKPGLDEEFRTEIEEPLTLEKLNAVANLHGTVYKTLE